jgi:hypothetical protein
MLQLEIAKRFKMITVLKIRVLAQCCQQWGISLKGSSADRIRSSYNSYLSPCLQSHIYVALDQGYISKELFDKIYGQADKTSRLISGLITYLRNNEKKYKQEKHI